MFCPTDVHKIFSNFKKRRGKCSSLNHCYKQVHSAKQPTECRIPLGLITSHRGINGAVAAQSSSPRQQSKQLYLEAEIGARLHQ